MEYQALYRRFRPQSFSDFVGQEHVVTTLSNALRSGKVAHAYLFTGPRGTGKTSTAKILAKALNCENPEQSPCDECNACRQINEGSFMDVLEIDGASNRGIDEIRDLRDKVKFSPAVGKYKIYIIDEVHMLTAEAFNALLKTLEEPPKFVVFILATTEAHKIPATILSRCQRFDFKRFTLQEIESRLGHILEQEGVQASGEALTLIASHAEGGMRDALSLLEQSLAHSGKELREADVRALLGLTETEVLSRIAEAIWKHDTKTAMEILNRIHMDGKDLYQFGRSLLGYFRDLLLKVSAGEGESEFTPGKLIVVIEVLASATVEVKKSMHGALPLELAFIKLTTSTAAASDLESRIARLEAAVLHSGMETAQAKSGAKPIAPEPQPSRTEPVTTRTEPQFSSGDNTGADFAGWERFLELVKNRKRTLAALIQEGKPVFYDGKELKIGFPPHLKFHLENLSLAHNKELLENLFRECFGTVVKISCVPMGTQKPGKEEPKPSSGSGGKDLLDTAVKMFGGEVVPLSKEE